MEKNHPMEMSIQRQIYTKGLHQPGRWAFLICCLMAVCIIATGCITYYASLQWGVDPEFAKTHDLNFKQPSTQTKAVLLFETAGHDGIPKDPYKNGFLAAIQACGAFSQVAEVSNEHDLQNYAGWDVVRVQLTCLGQYTPNWLYSKNIEFKYQVKVRFDLHTAGSPVEYDYSSGTWQTGSGGKPPTDETHPLGDRDQEANQFAKELILAACSEAQKGGKYFQ